MTTQSGAVVFMKEPFSRSCEIDTIVRSMWVVDHLPALDAHLCEVEPKKSNIADRSMSNCSEYIEDIDI
jgi:hypothetical protein